MDNKQVITTGYWIHTAAPSDLYLRILGVYPCSTGYKCKVVYLRKKDDQVQYIGKSGIYHEYVIIQYEDAKWWRKKQTVDKN